MAGNDLRGIPRLHAQVQKLKRLKTSHISKHILVERALVIDERDGADRFTGCNHFPD